MFSVIMPCYNSEAYVRDALESVVNQTFQNWELIAVNDGSVDNTLAILEQFALRDSRIRIFSKENGGYCSAINHGLDRIQGEYFLFMGSDDKLAPTLFESLSSAIAGKCPSADIVGFRTLRFVDGKNEGLDAATKFNSCVAESGKSIAEFEALYPEHARIFSVRDTSRCYRSALLGDLRYYGKYGYDADGIFSMLFCHRANSFLSVPVDGYYWTLRKDSLSGRPTTKEVDRDRLENWMKFYHELNKCNPSMVTQTERLYIGCFISIAESYCKKTRFSEEIDRKVLKNSRVCILELQKKYGDNRAISWKGRLSTALFLRYPKLWLLLKVAKGRMCSLRER